MNQWVNMKSAVSGLLSVAAVTVMLGVATDASATASKAMAASKPSTPMFPAQPDGKYTLSEEDMAVKVPGGYVRWTRDYDGNKWRINARWANLKLEFDEKSSGFVAARSTGSGGGGAGASGASLYVPPPPPPQEVFGGTEVFGYRPTNMWGDDEPPNGPLQWTYRNGAVFTADDSQITFTGLGTNRYVLRPIFTGNFNGTSSVPSGTIGGGTVTRKGIFVEHLGATPGVGGFKWMDRDGSFIDFDAFGAILRYGDRNDIVVTFDYAFVGGTRRVNAVRDENGRAIFEILYSDGQISEVRDVPASGDPAAVRSVKYEYGPAGSISKVTDVRGNDTTYGYDSLYRLTSIQDPEGNIQRIEYGATNRMVKFTEADGGVTDYSYEYDKNKKEFFVRIKYPQTDAGRRVEDRWYSKEGVLRSVTVNGKTIMEVTNASNDGRNVSYTDARGGKTTIVRNEFDLITGITYPDGGSIRVDYDSQNLNVLSETDENGVRTQYTYDERGNLAGVIEAAGTADARHHVVLSDAMGNITSWTVKGRREADGTTSPDATETYEFNADHYLTRYVDAEGKVRLYEYDRHGDMVKVTEPGGGVWQLTYDAHGNVKTVTDPLNNTVEYTYDKLGNILSHTDARGNVTSWTYDALSRETATRTPYGAQMRSTYDRDGNMTSAFDANGIGMRLEYDASGRLSRGVDAKGFEYVLDYADVDGLDKGLNFLSKIRYPTFERRYKYDARQRATQIAEFDGSDARTNSYSYDKVGRQRTITDANGKTRQIEYDALGQVKALRDPMGNTVSFSYNALGNLIKITDPRGNITRFTTDKRGLVTSEIDPLGKVTQYGYDDNGWLTEVRLPNGKRTIYVYDLGGRVTERKMYDWAGAIVQTVTLGYDVDNNLTSWSDGTYTGTLTYDNDDRLLSKTVNYGTFSLSYSYTYYPNNQVKTFTGADGLTIGYFYDGLGQLERVSIPGEGDITVTEWTWSSRKRVLLPGGASQEFEYDGLLDMTRMRVKTPNQQTLFELENKYGLLQEVKERSVDGVTTEYSYDDAWRLTGTDAANSVTYTLDAAGNRVAATPMPGSWVYDAANQLITKGDVTYSYDDAGNLIRKVDLGAAEPQRTTTYEYDGLNRLLAVKDGADNLISRYTYDPFDARLSKEVFSGSNAGTTFYLHSHQGVVAEATSAGVVTTTYGWHPEEDYGTNALFARVPAPSGVGHRYVYYHNDQLGTPYRITDSSGTLVWSASYDTFGVATVASLPAPNAALAVTNNLRFGGQYFDAETGLHYNDRRYYETSTGRYITRDPLGFEGGPNQYLYANHNPVNFYDPTGEILPCLFINYVRCVASCVAIGKVQNWINGCQVSLGDLALECAKDCVFSIIPIPNPCGKWGKYISMGMGAMGGMNSFTGDTIVHTRDLQGNPFVKPISELKVGDEVLAWSEWKPEGEALSYEHVTEVFSSLREQQLVKITFNDGETLAVTAGHPFLTTEGWRDAGVLQAGSAVWALGGESTGAELAERTITGIERESSMVPVFNLTVANAHTYFVGDGYLVHNDIHHICTKYGERGERMNRILKKAGFPRGYEDPLNKVKVPGHKGPHPEEYHDNIEKRLEKAAEKGKDAVKDFLKRAARQARTPGTRMNDQLRRRNGW